MPEHKQVVITLRKHVEDQDKAEDFYEEVKDHLDDIGGITFSGHYSNHFIEEIPE